MVTKPPTLVNLDALSYQVYHSSLSLRGRGFCSQLRKSYPESDNHFAVVPPPRQPFLRYNHREVAYEIT